MKIKQTLLAGTAAIALVAGVNIGLAQSPGGSVGGAEPKAQGAQQGQGTQRSGSQGQTREGGQGQTRGQAQGQRDPMTGQGQREGAGQRDGAGQREMPRGQAQERDGQRERTGGQKSGERDRTTDRKDADRDRDRAAGQKDEMRDRERTGQKDGERDRSKTTEQRREGARDKETTGAAPANVTTEQRTRIREHRSALVRGRVERSRINFNISVGTVVPRTVTFYELPPTIVEVVPAWRGYRYILVEDEIVIIDPGSYRIIAVIDA